MRAEFLRIVFAAIEPALSFFREEAEQPLFVVGGGVESRVAESIVHVELALGVHKPAGDVARRLRVNDAVVLGAQNQHGTSDFGKEGGNVEARSPFGDDDEAAEVLRSDEIAEPLKYFFVLLEKHCGVEFSAEFAVEGFGVACFCEVNPVRDLVGVSCGF